MRKISDIALPLLYLSLLSLFCTPASAAPSAAELKKKISAAVAARPALQQADVGIYIKVLKTGRVIYNLNGSEPTVPASNLKLVTTALVLDRLGPKYRFETLVMGPEADDQGVINGDLIIKGNGDPTFCPPYNQPADEPLRFFVRELRDQGVKRVTGNVVADDSAFDRQFLGEGWYDRYLLDSYAAPVAALSLNANLVSLDISTQGIVADPSSPSLKLVNKVKPGGYREVWVERERGSDTIVVKGVLPEGVVVQRGLTINNPTAFTAGTFARMLVKGGLTLDGGLKLLPEGQRAQLTGLKTYAKFTSPPALELVRQVNKQSDNLFAQHLFKAVGREFKGVGSAENAEAAVRAFFRRHRLPLNGLKMVDGSGLSELNRISPEQLVGVLGAMWQHQWGQEYIDSLPSGGQGTLRYRLNGTVVRAKTGTLKNSSGLSGYVVSSYGQTLAFSVLVNNVNGTWPAVELEDYIVKMLANWPEPL